MNPSLYLSIFSMILSIILLIVLFVGKKAVGVNGKILKSLAFIALGNTLLEVFGVFLGSNYEKFELLNDIMLRAMLVFYIAWFSVFIIFILNVARSNKKMFISNRWPLYVVMAICMILTVVLPITAVTNNDGVIIYSNGPAVDIVRFYTLAANFICLIIMFKNMKNIKVTNYSSLFVLIVLSTLMAVIQTYKPEMLLMTSVESIMCIVIYYDVTNKKKQLGEKK